MRDSDISSNFKIVTGVSVYSIHNDSDLMINSSDQKDFALIWIQSGETVG